MVQARDAVGRRLSSHPQESTGEDWWADVLADPRAPRREPSTEMAVKGKYAVPAQSWSLRGSGDCHSCMSCRPSLKTCSI
jgi:hypothetical protein